jgi:hypothetical protein
MPISNRLRIALATITLLAMITAPLCGPLCAAVACMPSTESQTANCHDGATLARSDSQGSTIGATKTCNLSELPAAKLSESTSRIDRHKQRSAVLVLHPPAFAAALTKHAKNRQQWRATSGPDGLSDRTTPTVLRI